MFIKDQIRRRYLKIRKKKYFEINDNYFKPFFLLLKKLKIKPINLSLYYPSNYEINTLRLLKIIKKKDIISLLPAIVSKNNIQFYQWKYLDTLKINKFGMLEPNMCKNPIIPNVLLVPLLAFDNMNYRLGYGKGYYDRFLSKYLKINKNILTIGVAFSFQKYDKLPTTQLDIKLDYILTEKGITKI
jgi:5-formyltetrahydrofolate cyclo-ligase